MNSKYISRTSLRGSIIAGLAVIGLLVAAPSVSAASPSPAVTNPGWGGIFACSGSPVTATVNVPSYGSTGDYRVLIVGQPANPNTAAGTPTSSVGTTWTKLTEHWAGVGTNARAIATFGSGTVGAQAADTVTVPCHGSEVAVDFAVLTPPSGKSVAVDHVQTSSMGGGTAAGVSTTVTAANVAVVAAVVNRPVTGLTATNATWNVNTLADTVVQMKTYVNSNGPNYTAGGTAGLTWNTDGTTTYTIANIAAFTAQ